VPNYAILQNNPMDQKIYQLRQLVDDYQFRFDSSQRTPIVRDFHRNLPGTVTNSVDEQSVNS